MAAELITENATETVKSGFVELGVNQVWQVITATRSTDFTAALGASGLPALGSAGTFGGQTLYAISRVPNRVDDDATGKKWNVTVQYSNSTEQFNRNSSGQPVSNPTQSVKEVNIQFLEYAEPITDAEFLNVTKGGGYSVGTAISTQPTWIDNGNVTVSTGETVSASRTSYRQVITVSRMESSWTSTYEDFTNTVNNSSVTITESDASGTKATYTFAANTLRMKPITKQPVWKDGSLYFRISFPMEHKPDTWIHSEYDRSQSERIFVGQTKPGGGTYTQLDVDALYPDATAGTVKFGIQTITEKTKDGDVVAVGNPRPLNGFGARLGVDATGNQMGESRFVNWEIYDGKDFGTLNL